jgi:DNA-binding response OmpR family regulator
VEPPEAAGARILVAEDEFLVYLALEEELRGNGFAVAGPYSSLLATRDALALERFDLALLDINMGGEMIWPIADELISRKIPFLFLTGYSAESLPGRFRHTPRLCKPYDPAELLHEIRSLLAG